MKRKRIFHKKHLAVFHGLLITLAAILVSLAALELGLRLLHGKPFAWINLIDERLKPEDLPQIHPMVYEPTLGWIPRGQSTLHKPPIKIAEAGIRDNGISKVALRGKPILAVGDSFTFGEGVGDEETWPAYLSTLTARPTLNAGVPGYGLDQTYLRAKMLLPDHPSRFLIVSFIADDVERCALSVRTRAAKPYYDWDREAGLLLRNVPVPRWDLDERRMDGFRRVLGYSHLVNFLMLRARPLYWLGGKTEVVHESGLPIALALMDQFAGLKTAYGIPVIVIAQPTRSLPVKKAEICSSVLDAARKSGLLTLDFFPILERFRGEHPEEFRALYAEHMTATGNRFIAKELAAFLRRQGLLH